MATRQEKIEEAAAEAAERERWEQRAVMESLVESLSRLSELMGANPYQPQCVAESIEQAVSALGGVVGSELHFIWEDDGTLSATWARPARGNAPRPPTLYVSTVGPYAFISALFMLAHKAARSEFAAVLF